MHNFNFLIHSNCFLRGIYQFTLSQLHVKIPISLHFLEQLQLSQFFGYCQHDEWKMTFIILISMLFFTSEVEKLFICLFSNHTLSSLICLSHSGLLKNKFILFPLKNYFICFYYNPLSFKHIINIICSLLLAI